jgi:hypothetical protein
MPELLALVIVCGVLIAIATVVSVKRRLEFERALAAAGFVTSRSVPPTPDLFHRPGVIISRVAAGTIGGVPTTFLFGSRPGVPPPIEGTFVNPSIPVAAVLLAARCTPSWLEGWTDHRAYKLGWRPAYAAHVTSDGRILLAWDEFAELGADFKACCEALDHSWPSKQGAGVLESSRYLRLAL